MADEHDSTQLKHALVPRHSDYDRLSLGQIWDGQVIRSNEDLDASGDAGLMPNEAVSFEGDAAKPPLLRGFIARKWTKPDSSPPRSVIR